MSLKPATKKPPHPGQRTLTSLQRAGFVLLDKRVLTLSAPLNGILSFSKTRTGSPWSQNGMMAGSCQMGKVAKISLLGLTELRGNSL